MTYNTNLLTSFRADASEKKLKKMPPHKKIHCLRTLHTFVFALKRTWQTQGQSQKSAIANALLMQRYSLSENITFEPSTFHN